MWRRMEILIHKYQPRIAIHGYIPLRFTTRLYSIDTFYVIICLSICHVEEDGNPPPLKKRITILSLLSFSVTIFNFTNSLYSKLILNQTGRGGFEPPIPRLTAGCNAIMLPTKIIKKLLFKELFTKQ